MVHTGAKAGDAAADLQIERSTQDPEEARLAALDGYKLLDTPPEVSFDNITQLAAALTQTPVALLSLVGRDRLFNKSRFGTQTLSRSRAGAFCDTVVRQKAPLFVPSAEDDARFRADVAVVEQGFKFYAGMPLVTADGHVIGSLCVLDTKPRVLQDTQKQALASLARQIMHQIDVRAELSRLRDTKNATRIDAEIFRSVLASSQEAVIIVDDHGLIQQWDGTAEAVFGYTPQERIGTPFATLFLQTPADLQTSRQADSEHQSVGIKLLEGVLEQPVGAAAPRTVYGRRKDGSICYLSVTGSRRIVQEQAFSCWVVCNISNRFESEQQQETLFRASMILSSLDHLPRAAPELLRLICRGLGWDAGSFWVEDTEQGRLSCAGSWSKRLEQSLANGGTAPDMCPLDTPIAEDDLLSTVWSEGAPIWIPDVKLQGGPAGMRPADPKTRSLVCLPLASINACFGVLELTNETLKLCDKDVMHCLQQLANQTGQFLRRYSLEQSMRISEQRFRSLFVSTAVSMALLSSKGTMQAVNRALCAMVGRDEAQLLGQSFFNSVSFEDPDAIKEATRAMLAGKREYFQCQVQCQHREGYTIWAAANISVTQNDNRNAPGFVVQMLDMTTQRRNAEALRRAKEQAEGATRAKSDFLARMSHEIRTPLNGVIGMADLAMQTPLSFEQTQYLSVLRSSATSLLALVNDLLDYSKSEAGRMTLEEIGFSLRGLVQQASGALQIRAQEKKLRLHIDVDKDVPDHLRGDPQRLQQILVNLLANAIKFTSQGSVTLRVRSEGTQANRVHLLFGVQDTGIGISANEQVNLFKAFGQGNDTTHRRFGGTGLGLAICQQLLELMGGRIWINSEPGAGSTFFFSLSLPQDAHVSAPAAAPAALIAPRRQLEVLVAEDNAVNRLVASGLLTKAGHKVTLVEDGHQAVAALDPGHRFDVVLMDLQMPLMGGLEATRTIRQREAARGAHTPIVALTAQAIDGDQDACLQAGMDAYLSKPLNLAKLLQTLEAHTAMPTDRDRNTPAPAAFAEKKGQSPAPYDRAELLERLSGDEALFDTIVAVFVGDLDNMQYGLHQAVEAQDPRRIQEAAHKLKGALLNLSAEPAAALARSLEDLGRHGVLDASQSKAAALDAALSTLRVALTTRAPHAS